MVQVTVRNNVVRKTVVVDGNTTLRAVLEENNIDYSRGQMHLDGSTLNPGDLDRTFNEIGIKEKCFLCNVVKADNA